MQGDLSSIVVPLCDQAFESLKKEKGEIPKENKNRKDCYSCPGKYFEIFKYSHLREDFSPTFQGIYVGINFEETHTFDMEGVFERCVLFEGKEVFLREPLFTQDKKICSDF